MQRVLPQACEQLGPLGRAADPDSLERRAERRGHRRRGEHEGARLDPEEVDHVGRPGDEPAAAGQRLREGPHPQVDLGFDA